MIYRRFLIVLLVLSVGGWQVAEARVPGRQQMQQGCVKTGGQWRSLPVECDNMHPRAWDKLSRQQQQQCMESFHEPCECGSGKRFLYMDKIGCFDSRFPSDK
jgi:hypothetical protein